MLPKVFIGSSKENLRIVETIQRILDRVAEVQSWTAIFTLSSYTLESLINATEEYDFGIFVFSPDDIVERRGKKYLAVRDNVVFELGLFVGRLGKERNFIVLPRILTDDRSENIQLPSDLLGITPATYDATNKSNLDAALGPACSAITREIERLGTRNKTIGTLTKDIAQPVLNATESASAAMLRKMGIQQVYPNRRGIDYVDFILKAKAKSDIKMMGITMRDLQAHDIRTAMERKLKSGCTIKILLLDRNSNFVKERANTEIQGTERWKNWESWKEELIKFDDLHQRYIDELPSVLQRNIKIGHYDALPVFSIFINGRTMIIGFYLSSSLGGSSPHLQLELKRGGVCSAFESYFDSLWPSD